MLYDASATIPLRAPGTSEKADWYTYRMNMKRGTGIAIGIALGLLLGTLMHNIGAGIAVGVAIGVALEAWNRKK